MTGDARVRRDAGPTLRLRLRDVSLDLHPGRPLLMGVVNASPESFFEGGRRRDLEALVEQGHELAAQGAEIIDVGGESSVTHLQPVSAGEEARRAVPVIERLAAGGLIVSVDTWKAGVARAALDAGAAMVNDVSGLRDPALAEVCASSGAALVVTHTRAAPKVKAFPGYADVGADVLELLRERIGVARERGVADDQLVLDPGPDLSKTPAETVEALRGLGALRALGRPILLAVSRKDFVGAVTHRPPRERLAGTLAAVGEGVDGGASIVRTHDVAAVADFMGVRRVLRGEKRLRSDARLEESLRRDEPAAADR